MKDLDKFKNEMNLSGKNVYVGHRYVPKIFGEWNNQQIYEPLSIVLYQGNSFTSRQFVPVGVEITNEEFWVSTGNYNAQIEYYRQDVENIRNDYASVVDDVNSNTNELNDAKKSSENVLHESLNDRINAQVQHVTYAMFGVNDQVKFFNQSNGKYYLDEDYTIEYDHNDAIEIKQAHDFANQFNLPVKVAKGHYLIKSGVTVNIMTPTDFGESVFHMQEDDYTRDFKPFVVSSENNYQTIETPTNFTLTKGQKRIKSLSSYAGYLALISHNAKQEGFRYGNVANGNQVRDYVYIDNSGEILGDITHDFDSNVNIQVKKADDTTLIIQGGTFLWNGRTGMNTQENVILCVGFLVKRDKVTFYNQTVKYEDNAINNEVSWANGFYAPERVYDFELNDIRISPRYRVNNGASYAISGVLVLNFKLDNIKGISNDVDHWGTMGTNEITNLIVENSNMKRIDVHYKCWNLTVKNSELQWIGVSGGGDMNIDNTIVRNAVDGNQNRVFIAFRTDYGATWNGDINITNSKLILEDNENINRIMLLSFQPSGVDYGYPIVFGKKVLINNFDFVFTDSESQHEVLLYDNAGSRQFGEHRLQLPDVINMKDINVIGRELGVKMMKTGRLHLAKTSRKNEVTNLSDNHVDVKTNAEWSFENIYTNKIYDGSSLGIQPHFDVVQNSTEVWDDESVIPKIKIKNGQELYINTKYLISEIIVDESSISVFDGYKNNHLTFNNVKFKPQFNSSGDYKAVNAELSEVYFNNCKIYPYREKTGTENLGSSMGRIGIFTSLGNNYMSAMPASHIGTFIDNELITQIPISKTDTDIEKFKNHFRISPMESIEQWTEFN